MQPLRIRGEESAVALQGLCTATSRTTRGDPGTGGFGGQRLAERGPGRRAGGLVHRRAKVRALAPQGRAASEQSAGGALVRRRDRGLWPPATAAQRRHLVGSELGVCGRAAGHGWHGARLPQPAGAAGCGPEVGEPVPGAETRDGHDHAVTRGCHSLEQRCRRGCHGAVEPPGALVAHDADVHTPGMPVETAVQGGLSGGESPGGLLRVRAWLFPKASIPPG